MVASKRKKWEKETNKNIKIWNLKLYKTRRMPAGGIACSSWYKSNKCRNDTNTNFEWENVCRSKQSQFLKVNQNISTDGRNTHTPRDTEREIPITIWWWFQPTEKKIICNFKHKPLKWIRLPKMGTKATADLPCAKLTVPLIRNSRHATKWCKLNQFTVIAILFYSFIHWPAE